MAQAVGDAGSCGGARRGELAVGPEQARKAGRPDDQRHGDLAAEQGQALVACRAAGERPRQQLDRGERRLVAAQGDLVLGTAVDEIEHGVWQGATGQPPGLADAVDAPFERRRHADCLPGS